MKIQKEIEGSASIRSLPYTYTHLVDPHHHMFPQALWNVAETKQQKTVQERIQG